MAGLEAGGYPNIEHTDVYQSDNDCCSDHDVSRSLTIWHDNADTVDDDL